MGIKLRETTKELRKAVAGVTGMKTVNRVWVEPLSQGDQTNYPYANVGALRFKGKTDANETYEHIKGEQTVGLYVWRGDETDPDTLDALIFDLYDACVDAVKGSSALDLVVTDVEITDCIVAEMLSATKFIAAHFVVTYSLFDT